MVLGDVYVPRSLMYTLLPDYTTDMPFWDFIAFDSLATQKLLRSSLPSHSTATRVSRSEMHPECKLLSWFNRISSSTSAPLSCFCSDKLGFYSYTGPRYQWEETNRYLQISAQSVTSWLSFWLEFLSDSSNSIQLEMSARSLGALSTLGCVCDRSGTDLRKDMSFCLDFNEFQPFCPAQFIFQLHDMKSHSSLLPLSFCVLVNQRTDIEWADWWYLCSQSLGASEKKLAASLKLETNMCENYYNETVAHANWPPSQRRGGSACLRWGWRTDRHYNVWVQPGKRWPPRTQTATKGIEKSKSDNLYRFLFFIWQITSWIRNHFGSGPPRDLLLGSVCTHL